MDPASVPTPIARAIHQIAGHPAVSNVVLQSSGEFADAVVQIASGLPSRWQAAGVSPNGVRAIETITIRFSGQFPIVAPTFLLRDDFNRFHPHLQPRPADQPPEPCLTNGAPTELLRSRGIHGLLEQLVLWLERAALVELIAPQQGWEPTRRDQIDDFVVFDADLLRALPKRRPGTQAYTASCFTRELKSARHHAIVAHTTMTPLRESLVTDLTKNGGGSTLCIVAWSGNLPSGAPFVAEQYEPETVTSIATLHARANRLGSGEFLASTLGLLQSRLHGLKIKKPIPVAIVLMARRPCDVIGSNSPWELIPYVVEVSGGDDLGSTSSKPVRVAMHRHAINPELLQRATGDGSSEAPKPWTLLGCGSVGSKIALHMTRAGRAPTHVVDKSWITPHNYARHALIPHTPHDAVMLMPKAYLLAAAISSFGQSATPHDADLATDIAALPAGVLADDNAAFVVNATASLSTRDAIELARPSRRVRTIDACLFAEGRIGYLAVEGADANPSATDLTVEAYWHFMDDPALAALAFDNELQSIAIGQGCSSLTMPMSDARLSSLVAPMSERIATWHRAGLPRDAGTLLIGAMAADGMGQSWHEHTIPPWIPLADAASRMSVRISPRAHQKMTDAVTARPGVETGGVVVGRWSDATSTFHVVDVLPAPPDSVFSRATFVLGIEGLADAMASIITRSHGALFAIGTWHNHLVTSGASSLDRRTARALALQQHIPVLLLIHTPGGYRFITAEATTATVPATAPAVHPTSGTSK